MKAWIIVIIVLNIIFLIALIASYFRISYIKDVVKMNNNEIREQKIDKYLIEKGFKIKSEYQLSTEYEDRLGEVIKIYIFKEKTFNTQADAVEYEVENR